MIIRGIVGKLLDGALDAANTAAKVVGNLVLKHDQVKDGVKDTVDNTIALIKPKTPKERVAAELVAELERAGRVRSQTMPARVDTNSRFYKRLESYFLSDYLAAPSKATAKIAIDKIGAKFEGPATEGNYWEEVSLSQWNNQPIPEPLRKLRPKLPETVQAATNVLAAASVAELPFIDVKQLIGGDNSDIGVDADVTGGGKNISQLMHWATGVKYCDLLDQGTARDLFFAYEMWHLEGWDVFGEDSINDMIAEESGRIMGRMLLNTEITKENLPQKLGACFAEARAWVGSLIALRKKDLDAFASAETAPKAKIWWKDEEEVWPSPTLMAQAMKGKGIAELVASPYGKRITEMYGLVEDAKRWEKNNGPINHSLLVQNMIAGKLDSVLAAAAQNKMVLPHMAASAFINVGGLG